MDVLQILGSPVKVDVSVNQILPHLFAGNQAAAENESVLLQLQIHSIIHLMTGSAPEFPEDYEYLVIPIEDDNVDLKPVIAQTTPFIDQQLKEGKNVLVHCVAGVSRTGAVLVAYFMWKFEMSYDDALAAIREHRMIAPNKFFETQLRQYQEELEYERKKKKEE